MRNQRWVTGLLVLVAGPIVAADASLDAARRCAQVQDSLQRLVCYDRLFAAPAAAPAQAAVPAPAAPAPVAAESFGSEQLKRSEDDRQRDRGPETQRGKVAAVKETRPGAWRITLENDQVWQQTEADRYFVINAGDAVVIERGLLGSYHLEQADGGRRIRVSRVK